MAKQQSAKQSWLKKAVGEISKLRQNIFSNLGWRIIGGSYGAPYRLDSSRVDYAKARALYKNTDDDYKLGAGFAKPVINTTTGFMGVPHFRSEDVDVQAVLDDFFGNHVSRMQQVHRDALRDGDCLGPDTLMFPVPPLLAFSGVDFRTALDLFPTLFG